jgi:hypothetical protein
LDSNIRKAPDAMGCECWNRARSGGATLIRGRPMAFPGRSDLFRDKVNAKESLGPQSVRFSSTLNVELGRRAAAAG